MVDFWLRFHINKRITNFKYDFGHKAEWDVGNLLTTKMCVLKDDLDILILSVKNRHTKTTTKSINLPL